VYIVPRVASKRKAAGRKSPKLSPHQPPPEKPLAPTIAALALGLSIGGASLLVDPRAEAAFDAPKRLVALVGIVIASIAMLTVASFPPSLRWRERSPLQLAILALVGIAMLGSIVASISSPRRALSLDATRGLILFALCLPLGASRAVEGNHGVRLLMLFVIACALNALISILQALGLFQPLTIESIAGRVTSVGLIGNEGYLGLLTAMGAVASLCGARFAGSARARNWCWAALATMLVALAATRNVTGWLALAVGVIPLGWNLAKTRRLISRPVLIAAAVLLIGVIAIPGVRARAVSLVRQARSGDWDALLSYRTGAWAAAIDMIHEHPIVGLGPGTFGAEFVTHRLNAELRWGRRFVNPQSLSIYAQAHCDYLQALAENGIAAGLAAISAFVMLIAGLVRMLRRGHDGETPEGLLLLAVLLVGSVGALMWPTLSQPALATPLLLAAGRGWRLLGTEAHG